MYRITRPNGKVAEVPVAKMGPYVAAIKKHVQELLRTDPPIDKEEINGIYRHEPKNVRWWERFWRGDKFTVRAGGILFQKEQSGMTAPTKSYIVTIRSGQDFGNFTYLSHVGGLHYVKRPDDKLGRDVIVAWTNSYFSMGLSDITNPRAKGSDRYREILLRNAE